MNLRRFLTYFGTVQSFEPESTLIRFKDEDGRNLAVDIIAFDPASNSWTVELKPAPIGAPANATPVQ